MTSPRHLETPTRPATPVRAMREAVLKEAQAARRLEALERAKSGFVTTVGHELRTPLAAMLGYTELLRDGGAGPLNTEQQALLACVERNGARLSGLIDDLIKVARVQSEAFALPMDRVDVNGVVRSAVEARGAALAAIDLDLRIDPTDPLTTGSSKELEEVVSQLLSNAVKFTPPGGRVVVTTHHTDTACTIAVSDTGPGISVSEQEEVFDYFFRASSPCHRSAPGVGVGLSLAKAIVRECGGDITVTSGRGLGATFIVRLPLWDGARETCPDGDDLTTAEAS